MQLGLNIVMVVLNNAGWIAITDLQRAVLGEDHNYATEFTDNNGNVYTPNFAEIAKGFGCWGKRISTVSEIQPSLQELLNKMVQLSENYGESRSKTSGIPAWGWWDVPIPSYLEEKTSRV